MRLNAFRVCAVVFLSVLAGPSFPAGSVCAQGVAADSQLQTDEGISREKAFPVPAGNAAIFGLPPRPFHGRKGEDLVRRTGKECRDCHVGRYYPQADFFGWEARKKWQVHWLLFSGAGFLALGGVFASVTIWRMGKSPSLHHPIRWTSAARALLWEVILGRRIYRQSRLRWAIFLLVSMGFVSLALVFAVIAVTRYVFASAYFLSGAGGILLDFSADLLGACILVGCLLALYRRVRGEETHLKTEAEDIGILLLLLAIVLSGFFLEACRLAVVQAEPRTAASFVGYAAAQVLKAWDLPWTPARFYVWILHAVLVFSFFAYLPFSKLFHLITCPVSILATASESSYRQHQ